ncbi:MAG: hypothetical protein EXQ71_04600 [Acidimicrobiia bacterium]|nr:hypothetical protein [Acidimicrobiia bacterium]
MSLTGSVLVAALLLTGCGPSSHEVFLRCSRPGLVASSTGPVTDPALVEISGIVAGRVNPSQWWVHNDSGDSARLFALNNQGEVTRQYQLTGAMAVDWEDLAIGRGPLANTTYLYAADIGDNSSARIEILVYRVPEPVVTPGPAIALGGVEILRLRYPDGAHNAEALLVDPTTGDLVIVEKKLGGGVIGVYRTSGIPAAGSLTTLEKAGEINVGSGALSAVTGASISQSGREIALRVYGGTRIFARTDGQSVTEAMAGIACNGPTPPEVQGEAIAFDADGNGYATISEGTGQSLHHYRIP